MSFPVIRFIVTSDFGFSFGFHRLGLFRFEWGFSIDDKRMPHRIPWFLSFNWSRLFNRRLIRQERFMKNILVVLSVILAGDFG